MPTTERTVVTRLVANNDAYDRAMRRSAGETRNLAVAGGAAAKQVGQSSSALRASSEDLRTVGTTAGIAGLAIAAGFGLAVKTVVDFDKEMSNLAAVSGASAQDMGVLRDAVIEAGQASVFSASEAAKAASELAKAGISTQDILGGGLTGALNLAAAGNLDLATAAELSANAMTTFGLAGSDVPRIADSLAAGANKSAAEVADMGQALSQTGLVANQAGLSLEDTVGTLALFAQAGLKGSDAGTSLRTMLLRLNPSSVEAADSMRALGLEFYDAQGNFVGISGASELLRSKLAGLTDEQRAQTLQTIFGQDAIRAATILMENGATGVDQWTEAVSESGYAAEVANQKTDNLAGDLERLSGALESALIENGSVATDALRGIATGAELAVQGFSAMPGPLQATGGGIVGLAGAGLLAVGAFGTLLPKVREVQTALEGMGSTAQFIGRNLSTAALGAGIATAEFAVLSIMLGLQAQRSAEAAAAADAYANAISNANGEVDEAIAKTTAQNLAQHESTKNLQGTSANFELFGRAIRASGDELDNLKGITDRSADDYDDMNVQLRKAADGGSELAAELLRIQESGEVSGETVMHFIRTLENEQDAFRGGSREAATKKQVVDGLTGATEEATGAAEGMAGAEGDLGVKFDETTGKIEEQKTELQKYRDRLKEMFDPYFALMNAQDRLKGAQDDLTAAQLEYLSAVKDHGEKSYEAAAALDKLNDAQRGVWEAAIDSESALADLANLVSTGKITYQEAAAKVDGMATSLGWSKEQADQMKLALFYATVQAQEFDGDYQARLAIEGYDNVYSKLTALIALGRTFAEAWRIAVPEAPEGVKPFAGNNGGADNNPFTPQADGGIMRFASGGMTENHVAQIAPAGAMRLWAEAETGGEAYIPLAQGKRDRSEKILGAVANLFGFDLVKAFDGGISHPVLAAASTAPRSSSNDYSNRSRNITVSVKVDGRREDDQLARRIARDVGRELQRIEGSVSS